MEYLIGDFARITRLGIKTLRYYHEIALLKPSRVDPLTGYRYYDDSCLAQVRAITRLKDLNFSLAEIREILSGQNDDPSLLQTMQQKLTGVEGQIAALEQVRQRLAAFVHSESLPLILPGTVVRKHVPDQLIAALRFSGCYADLGGKITQLLEVCADKPNGPVFTLYYDDDHPLEAYADIEVCVPVSTPVESGPVHSRLLPGGEVLSIMHSGTYDQLWVSYQALVDYWNQYALQPVFPSREIYLIGGNATTAPTKHFLTEIQFLYA